MPKAKKSNPISAAQFELLQEGFEERVNKDTGIRMYDTLTECCWDWKGKPMADGAGVYQSDTCIILGITKAYRISMFLYKHEEYMANEELCVLHSCDRRICVNPAHLRMGTDIENINDRDTRGRQVAPKGESNGSAKFTDEQIKEIQELRRGGMIYTDIAAQYNVSRRTIEKICLGKKGYSDEVIIPPKMSVFEQKGAEVLRLRAEGMTYEQIAKVTHTSTATLAKWMKEGKIK